MAPVFEICMFGKSSINGDVQYIYIINQCIYIYIYKSINNPLESTRYMIYYSWQNYNDLTATEPWNHGLFEGNHPQMGRTIQVSELL